MSRKKTKAQRDADSNRMLIAAMKVALERGQFDNPTLGNFCHVLKIFTDQVLGKPIAEAITIERAIAILEGQIEKQEREDAKRITGAHGPN